MRYVRKLCHVNFSGGPIIVAALSFRPFYWFCPVLANVFDNLVCKIGRGSVVMCLARAGSEKPVSGLSELVSRFLVGWVFRIWIIGRKNGPFDSHLIAYSSFLSVLGAQRRASSRDTSLSAPFKRVTHELFKAFSGFIELFFVLLFHSIELNFYLLHSGRDVSVGFIAENVWLGAVHSVFLCGGICLWIARNWNEVAVNSYWVFCITCIGSIWIFFRQVLLRRWCFSRGVLLKADHFVLLTFDHIWQTWVRWRRFSKFFNHNWLLVNQVLNLFILRTALWSFGIFKVGTQLLDFVEDLLGSMNTCHSRFHDFLHLFCGFSAGLVAVQIGWFSSFFFLIKFLYRIEVLCQLSRRSSDIFPYHV